MDHVKYSKIAYKYEKNPERTRNLVIDGDLFNYIYGKQSDSIKILDIACGTGIYLEFQQRFLCQKHIEWAGIDAEGRMLEIAKSKVQNAKFFQAKAESLPFVSEYFDYLYCSFAFHHFTDKSQALQEIYRVLISGGMVKIITISPEFLDGWYIYRFFPESRKVDIDRCWKANQIMDSMEQLGFRVEMRIEYIHQKFPAKVLYEIAKNRDISELVLLDEDHYREGLDRIKREADLKMIIPTVFAKVILKGIK